MDKIKECRSNSLPLTLTRSKDNEDTISGYALRFYRKDDPGTQFELYPNIFERIAIGSVNLNDDVIATYNHNYEMLLGRTRSGTLELKLDSQGLQYSIKPSNTSCYRDVVEMLKRGDLFGSSFTFDVEEEEFDGQIRWLRSIRVYECGPVIEPAYQSATADLRSMKSYQNFVAQRVAAIKQMAKAKIL